MDAASQPFAPATALVAAVTRAAVSFAERLGPRGTASKSDASPVTAADLAIQALLVTGLRDAYGGSGMPRGGAGEVVGEESTAVFSGVDGDALRAGVHELVRSVRPELAPRAIDDAIDAGVGSGHGERQWIIDPIDGTRGYLSGQQYCVCLAYVERGVVEFGAAGCPRLGERGLVVAAARGAGAWAWDGLDHSATPRRLEARRSASRVVTASESPEASDRARRRLRGLATALGAEFAARPMESQCKFVLVATGDVDLAVRFPPRSGGAAKDMVWDYAGAVVMAEEAGATMTDCRGAPLRFGAGRAIDRNFGVLCAAPWAHARAVDRIRAMETEYDATSGESRREPDHG
ncbi:MAG: inositol monophosphatase family protein [Phycisphaerales bacterium]